MSFDDLPPNPTTMPIRDSRTAANVMDLIASQEARDRGCLAVMLCDEHDVGLQPVCFDDLTDDVDPWEVGRFLGTLFERESIPAVVVARGRPGGVLLTDADRAWHQMLLDVCRTHDVRVIGAFLATSATVRAFPAHLAAAS